MRSKSGKKNNTSSSSKRQIKNKKFYDTFVYIYQLACLEDMFKLKNTDFYKLCDVDEIDWYLNDDLFKNHSLLDHNCKKDLSTTTHYSCSLNYKNQIYGELIFILPKITKSHCRFLNKVSAAVSSSLYFMQNKKNLKTFRNQWEFTFDSFHKAFCITDSHFHILKFNKAFTKFIFHSNKAIGSNFFNNFLFSIKPHSKDGLWIEHGFHNNNEMGLEFSLKTIYLKNERLPVKLIQVTDVTEKIKMQKKIEKQSRQKELGFIKASVAHELNNPLAGIKMLLHLISSNLSPREEFIKETLQEMDKALKRCQDIIRNLLQASRPSEEERTKTLRSA